MKEISGKKGMVHMISILMGRACFLGINPIVIGYMAACYMEGAGGITLLLCSCIGVISKLGVLDGIPYLLILFFCYVLFELLEKRKPKIYPLLCYAIPLFFTAFVNLFVFRSGSSAEMSYLVRGLELLLVLIFPPLVRRSIRFILKSVKGVVPNNEEIVSIFVLLTAVLYAVPKTEYAYFSYFHTVIYFLILFMSFKYGIGQGAITGAVCGLVTCLEGGSIADVGIYCMLGIVPSLFRELGRIPLATVYIVTATGLTMFQYGEIFSGSEFGALISAVLLFLLLPSSLVYRAGEQVHVTSAETSALLNVRNIAKEKMMGYSESFHRLAEAYETLSGKNAVLEKQEVNHIFEDLSEKLCKNCSQCEQCWEKEFTQTYQAACDVFEVAEKKGYIEVEDIPQSFQSICMCADEFCKEANRGFEMAKMNRAWCNRMAESRQAIAGQFLEVSKVIKEMASDLYNTVELPLTKEDKIIHSLSSNQVMAKNITMIEKSNKRLEIHLKAACKRGRCMTTKEAASVISEAISLRVIPSGASKSVISKDFDSYIFVEDTKYKVLTGVARARKDKESVSGDNFSIQELETGEYMIAIADGMGSGCKACEESEEAISMLEQLVVAGFGREVAIKLVNSSMVLKSDEQTFSTIDMTMLNLFTGMCDFVKVGAAAAFIKRNDFVETVESATLPAGMFHHVDYETVTKKLYDGDIIIMVTDGILESFKELDKEEYLRSIIADMKCSNPKEIANRILELALKQQNEIAIDDMTVITAGIWEKVS